MKDEGCMLRAFKRNIVELMVSSQEASTFIPALALTYAHNPTEVPVAHESRAAGPSSYNFYKLIRYNFDLVTGFSLVPLQVFTIIGMIVSLLSGLLVVDMVVRRMLIGPEVEGVFTLFAILFFLVGICLLGLGILGEYIGRIYQEVRKRPRFVIRNILEK
jgi:undecaprenyl-phosphate 4-deoxy-4-formamido-L-arabinose transferase